MDLRLSYDQRARLELIAIHSGVSIEQLVIQAAELLLEWDAADSPVAVQAWQQQFLSSVELDERFVRLLRH
jgi:hypothetical protein